VGIGWEAGLLVGMGGNGVDVSQADLIVGTSAGSVVGFELASGGDLTRAAELVNSANEADGLAGAPGRGGEQGTEDLQLLIAAVAEAAADPGAADQIRAKLGRMALDAPVVTEQRWLEAFAQYAGADWPEHFACTAVDTATGRFQVWDRSSGVDVQRGVASSCAVPGIFPPVTIAGSRWMDGGVRDMLNADVAVGKGKVLVVSCTVLDIPPGLALPSLDAMFGATRGRLEALRRGGAEVEVVVPGPEMLEVSGWGMNLMDFSRAEAAYEAGVRQGKSEAERLVRFWG